MNNRIMSRARALATVAVLALGTGAALAQDEGEVLAVVDGEEITRADVAQAERDLGNALGALPEGERESYLVTFLIDLKLLANQAEGEGVEDEESFQTRLDYLRDKALMEIYLDERVQGEISDEQVRAFYDEQIAAAETEEEVRARHILVESEDEASALIEQLDEGADFEELANENTTDPSGQENGGDLGFFTQGQMVPEFSEAAFGAEIGEVVGPVETQFGWHVIKIEERREQEPPALEEVEERVRAYLVRQAQADMIAELRAEAEIDNRTAPPAAETPAEDAPESDAPETDAPETDAPETDAPETDAPETGADETGADGEDDSEGGEAR